MKRLFLVCAVLMMSTVMWAQGVKPLPSLHVEGRWLVDQHGNHVVLHGVMDTPNMYFNGWRWGSPWDPNNYADYNEASVSKCLDYFEKLFTAMEKSKCTIFRLHLDPAWTNDPSSSYTYSGAKDQPADAGRSFFKPTDYFAREGFASRSKSLVELFVSTSLPFCTLSVKSSE